MFVRSRSHGALTIHTAAGTGTLHRAGVPLDPKRSPRPPRVTTGAAVILPGMSTLTSAPGAFTTPHELCFALLRSIDEPWFPEMDSVAHSEPPFTLIHDVVSGDLHKTASSERQQFLAAGVYVFDR